MLSTCSPLTVLTSSDGVENFMKWKKYKKISKFYKNINQFNFKYTCDEVIYALHLLVKKILEKLFYIFSQPINIYVRFQFFGCSFPGKNMFFPARIQNSRGAIVSYRILTYLVGGIFENINVIFFETFPLNLTLVFLN